MQCFNLLVASYCSVITRASYDKTKEEFEDTNEIIRSRKSKKDKQHNGQKKKDKRPHKDIQSIYIKLKI